jgi:hypothetical protein
MNLIAFPRSESFYDRKPAVWTYLENVNMLFSDEDAHALRPKPNQEVLDTILELGWVSSDKRKIIWPRYNLWAHQRMPPFVQFLTDFSSQIGPFNCYFTLYDGWREKTEPSQKRQFRRISIDELKENYIGFGNAGEHGRFVNHSPHRDLFPVLEYPVIAFNRHIDDETVILIPDTNFIQPMGYSDLRREIDELDVPWNDKIAKIVWRGGNHGSGYEIYNMLVSSQKAFMNQRELLMWQISINPKLALLVDAAFASSDRLTKSAMLKFKFQLDIDGEVNAWEGLFWKLYSNCVVFKVESHFEQWYYKSLKPMEHYVPIKGDLSDLCEKLEWAIFHDDECRRIALNGQLLAKELTYNKFSMTQPST